MCVGGLEELAMRFRCLVVLPVVTALLSALPAAAQNSPIAPTPPSQGSRLAEDVAFAKDTISRLQLSDFKAVRQRLERPSEVSDDVLRKMAYTLGVTEPISVDLISAKTTIHEQTGNGFSRAVLEYEFGDRWVVARATVRTAGGEKWFRDLHLTLNGAPLSELNAFHLFGKGPPQYLFLFAWILALALSGCAIYLAFRRHTGWRKWALGLPMPLGLTPAFALNWNTAQAFVVEFVSTPTGSNVPLFALHFPMASFGRMETGAPYLYISAPLIAIAYLSWYLVRGRSRLQQA